MTTNMQNYSIKMKNGEKYRLKKRRKEEIWRFLQEALEE